MIVADRKPLQEILDMIKDFNKILIIGCKGCVTVCNVGESKEVGILASSLKIAWKKEGRNDILTAGFCQQLTPPFLGALFNTEYGKRDVQAAEPV